MIKIGTCRDIEDPQHLYVQIREDAHMVDCRLCIPTERDAAIKEVIDFLNRGVELLEQKGHSDG